MLLNPAVSISMEHEAEEGKPGDADMELSPREQTKFLCKLLASTSLDHLDVVNQKSITSLDFQGKYF